MTDQQKKLGMFAAIGLVAFLLGRGSGPVQTPVPPDRPLPWTPGPDDSPSPGPLPIPVPEPQPKPNPKPPFRP